MFSKKILIALLLLGLNAFAFADISQDTGQIKLLDVNAGGVIAVHLKNGFPNAVLKKLCPTADGYWAGLNNVDKSLKAALIAAKVSGANVKITISGCEAGGAWFNLLGVTFL